jgi:hypothetical protein
MEKLQKKLGEVDNSEVKESVLSGSENIINLFIYPRVESSGKHTGVHHSNISTDIKVKYEFYQHIPDSWDASVFNDNNECRPVVFSGKGFTLSNT